MPQTTKSQMRQQLARYVRSHTNDGSDIVEFYIAVFQDNLYKDNKKVKVTLKMQIDAAAWLGDRGWGKAPQEISVEGRYVDGEEEEALAEMSVTELTQGIALMQGVPD